MAADSAEQQRFATQCMETVFPVGMQLLAMRFEHFLPVVRLLRGDAAVELMEAAFTGRYKIEACLLQHAQLAKHMQVNRATAGQIKFLVRTTDAFEIFCRTEHAIALQQGMENSLVIGAADIGDIKQTIAIVFPLRLFK